MKKKRRLLLIFFYISILISIVFLVNIYSNKVKAREHLTAGELAKELGFNYWTIEVPKESITFYYQKGKNKPKAFFSCRTKFIKKKREKIFIRRELNIGINYISDGGYERKIFSFFERSISLNHKEFTKGKFIAMAMPINSGSLIKPNQIFYKFSIKHIICADQNLKDYEYGLFYRINEAKKPYGFKLKPQNEK